MKELLSEQPPSWARFKRTRIVPPVFKNVPSFAGDIDKITNARLSEAVRELQSGDFSKLRASYPATTATGARGLETICDPAHYLDQGDEPGNRLLWWGKTRPPTSELSAYQPFTCQFHPALRESINWEPHLSGQAANENRASRFTFLDQPSRIMATVQRLQVTVMAGAEADSRTTGEHSVIVNAISDDFRFDDPQQPWPPMTIVFDQSQRAVGIEYGFAGTGDISPVGVQLTAYSSTGRELVRSHGGEGGFGSPPYIRPGEVFHRIGVQDWWGEIRYVIFSVTTDRAGEIDPGQPIRTPPLIYRIWHESMPPAVMKQGFTETAWSRGSTVSTTNHPTESLPFRCNKWSVMLRGFRVAFLDGQARQITGLEVGLQVQHGRDGIVILPSVTAGLHTTETPAPPRMVRVYYTLLAWDSEQVDANVTGISGGVIGFPGAGRPRQDEFGTFLLTELRTPAPSGVQPGAEAFAVFTGFQTRFGERNVEHIQLAQGHAFRDTGQSLVWPVTLAVTDTQATIFGYHWQIYGQVFTGNISGGKPLGYTKVAIGNAGLTAGGVARRQLPLGQNTPPDPRTRHAADAGYAVELLCGPRPGESDPDHFLPTAQAVVDKGFARAIEADMAFPALGTWVIDAQDNPIREIEVEVHSKSYDGAVLDWEAGQGVSIGGAEDADCLAIGPAPVFGQVSRTPRTRGRLAVQLAYFETVPGIVATSPVSFGAVQNLGPGPVLITGITQSGSNHFWVRLGKAGEGDPAWQVAVPPADLRSRVFALEDFYEAPPVQLLPDEVLLIGGRFYTDVVGQSLGHLVFNTNAEHGIVIVQLRGNTIPSNALAQFIPARINFGLQPVGTQRIRYALITSDGSTPLIITAIQIESAQSFSVLSPGGTGLASGNWQVDSGGSFEVPVIFAPVAEGQVSTRVTAETNAGQLSIELFGTGIVSS